MLLILIRTQMIFMAHYHGNDKEKINNIINDRMRRDLQKHYDSKFAEQTRLEAIVKQTKAIALIRVSTTYIIYNDFIISHDNKITCIYIAILFET